MGTGRVATVGVGLAQARPLRAYLALAAGVMCIGFTAIFTKWAAMPGPLAAAYRMGISSLVLVIPFGWQFRRRRTFPSAGAGLAVMGGLWFAINLAMLNSALLLTSAATATLLDNMAPLWVGLGAVLLFKERLRGRYWAGLGVALIGAAAVTGFNPVSATAISRGDLLAFGGSVFYAGYLLVTQRTRRDLDSLSYLWLAVTTAAVTLFATSGVMRIPFTGYSAGSYWAMFGAGLISQTGGWLLINYALGYLPASTAVVMLLAQPVVTGLLSIPLLGESLTVRQVTGGAFVLMGIYLCVREQRRNPELCPPEDIPLA